MKIDYRFKILYAVGIIMVCFGHTWGGGISLMTDWFPLGGFLIGMFVFCSGYFYRDKAEENVGGYVLKKVKSLLVPLYIYNLVYGVLVMASRHWGFTIGEDISLYNLTIAPFTTGHQFIYTMAAWFIAPLFMVEVYNVCLRKLVHLIWKNAPEWLFFVIGLAIGIGGCQLSIMGYNGVGWGLCLVRFMYFVPFYGLGCLYRRVLEQWDRKIPSFWYFVCVCGAQLAIICVYGAAPEYAISWCTGFEQGPVLPFVVGFISIAFWLRVAGILEPVIGRSKWINLIADNTFPIMMNQFVGFMLVKGLLGLITPEFDWASFKSDIWYYVEPFGIWQAMVLYVIGGIVVSLVIAWGVKKVKRAIRHVAGNIT